MTAALARVAATCVLLQLDVEIYHRRAVYHMAVGEPAAASRMQAKAANAHRSMTMRLDMLLKRDAQ